MTDFSRPPSFDFGAATLQGLKLPGGPSYLLRVAAWTALIVTLVYVVLGTPVVKAYVELFGNFIEMEHNLDGSDADPDVILAMMGPMFKAGGFIFLISMFQMAAFASAETAIYRNLFDGEDKGIFPLRLGRDELRVFGTRIIIGLVLGGVFFGLYIAALLFGALMFGMASGLGSGLLGAIGGLVGFFLMIAAIAVFVWVAVRLAPAAAYSVKNRRFDPFASWSPMNGRVWPAIGGYLILYMIGYFGISLVLSIVFVVAFLLTGTIQVLMKLEAGGEAMPDLTPLWEHMSSAGFLIPMILALLASLFMTVLWYGMIWGMWGYFAKTDSFTGDGDWQEGGDWKEGELWEMQ